MGPYFREQDTSAGAVLRALLQPRWFQFSAGVYFASFWALSPYLACKRVPLTSPAMFSLTGFSALTGRIVTDQWDAAATSEVGIEPAGCYLS